MLLNNTTQMPSYNHSVACCIPNGAVAIFQILFIFIDVILGISVNIVAIWIFCFRLKKWNTNTIFLINLVIADLLSLTTLLMKGYILNIHHSRYRENLLRICDFTRYVNRSASLGLMTVVAVYRYVKVVYPHHRLNRMTTKQACYLTALLWLIVICLHVPVLAFHYDHILHCGIVFPFQQHDWLYQAHAIHVVFEFFFPLGVLIFCSIRIYRILKQRQMDKIQKVRRAILLCLAIVVVFVICFLPLTVATIGVPINILFNKQNCATIKVWSELTKISIGMSFLKNALDPIIYCFSSSVFRDAFISLLPKALRCCGHEGNGVVPVSSEHTPISGTPHTKQQE